MYTNDLNNAYLYETERRMDEMRDAANCRLCHEAAGSSAKKASPLANVAALLLAFVAFFVKH